MARYTSDFTMEQNQQEFFNRAHQLLTSMGYVYVTHKGEDIFKKGDGWVTAPTCFKITYSGNTVRIEAWLKIALLPGVYISEHGLDGFYGFAVKDMLKGRVCKLEELIISMGGVPVGTPVDSTQSPVHPAVPIVENQAQPTVTNGNFCTNCGKALKPGSAFCSECGSPVKK